jgi:CRP-like cAMP-binding protein
MIDRSTTVVATTDVNTYAISRDRLQRLIEESPQARAGIEKAMAKRYQNSTRTSPA